MIEPPEHTEIYYLCTEYTKQSVGIVRCMWNQYIDGGQPRVFNGESICPVCGGKLGFIKYEKILP